MKINKIDALIFAIIALFIFLIVMSFNKTEDNSEVKATIDVKISQNVNEIKNEVEESVGKEVYMNGLREPVILKSYKKEGENLILVFEDNGYIKNDTYIFNGQRVLAGQKIELRGRFWSQGIITDIRYESN